MKSYGSILSSEIKEFLTIRQASKSKSAYDHDVQILWLFDQYMCVINCRRKDLGEQQVTGWINTLTGKTSSIANKVIVVRKFLEFLNGYGIKGVIPCVPKVHDDYLSYIFSGDELCRIFEQADTYLPVQSNVKYAMLHIQMPVVLRIMYGCGLRIGETLSLKMADVDLDVGILILRHPKGEKQRIVPMHQTLTAVLEKYCRAMGIIADPEAFMFGTADGTASVACSATWYRFDKILQKAGISMPGRKKHERGPCLHCLRHVFVFKSFIQTEQMGIPVDNTVPYLSIFLGHDSLKETEKYLCRDVPGCTGDV